MRKNRPLTCLAELVLALGMQAQTKAVRVESPIVTEKDFVWYVEQKEAWKAETQRNPKNPFF